MTVDSPIRQVKGIGAKTEEVFHRAGVYTVGDILLYFPRDYERYPDVVDADEVIPDRKNAVVVKVQKKPSLVPNSKMQLAILDIQGTHTKLRVTWFRSPYVRNLLEVGKTYILYGIVKEKSNGLTLEQPEIFSPEKYMAVSKTLQPKYPLTAGLSNSIVQKTIRSCLDEMHLEMEYLPEEIRLRNRLCEYNYALEQIHFPKDEESCIAARNRLVFDEFFLFLLAMRIGKTAAEQTPTSFFWSDDGFTDSIRAALPYELTEAQLRTFREIQADMASGYVMQRLVQGDVGSGKTIIAFLAMLDCAHHNVQSAIMAPTDVLARQHYDKLTALCQELNLDYPVILLTGSLTAKQKREAYEKLVSCKNALVVGTHALIQDKPQYCDLALVVTDEQHRFGVKQREAFSKKGISPHILVMSATPIPRTLAIILYGDLDISVIDQVPAQRLPIKNCVVDTSYRPTAYRFIAKEIEKGRQAYIICPFVEASETMEGENVLAYAQTMKKQFESIGRVGVLHGKMRPEEKNQIMEAYLKNDIQILVSTTVVEVGVDVPNASVMMIENAERFGLAQLHQLRGRVGRGSEQSYCIMIDGSGKKKENKRLSILNKTNDGFEIAAQDLKLRGPGDFFGIRQSGEFSFRLADVFQDAKMLQTASYEAGQLLQKQAEVLENEHFVKLRKYLERYQKDFQEHMNL